MRWRRTKPHIAIAVLDPEPTSPPVRYHRLVVDRPDLSLAVDFHPRLTVIGTPDPDHADRVADAIDNSLSETRAGHHLEFSDPTGRSLVVFRPHGGRAAVFDVHHDAICTAEFADRDGGIDVLGALGAGADDPDPGRSSTRGEREVERELLGTLMRSMDAFDAVSRRTIRVDGDTEELAPFRTVLVEVTRASRCEVRMPIVLRFRDVGLHPATQQVALDLLLEAADGAQVVLVTDDPDVLGWADLESIGRLALVHRLGPFAAERAVG